MRRTANTVEDIVFAHLYPRLDIAVSRHLNHLLKAPFAIHPKTGRVCTPMDISKVDDFDPTTVPTIGLLFEEMEKLGPDVKRKTEWQHTSMKGRLKSSRSSSTGCRSKIRPGGKSLVVRNLPCDASTYSV